MTELDYQLLEKELDRVKTRVFLGSNAAFLGPLMCSITFTWSEEIPTAATNGNTMFWNPHWFLELPPETRVTVLLHELWHIALLHMIRRGSRDPRIWNYACDIAINNMLDLQGHSFEGTSPWLNHDYGTLSGEEIYDLLIQQPELKITGTVWTDEESDDEYASDLLEPEEGEGGVQEHAIINKVVQASTAATMAGAGNVPGEVETLLKRFLAPKLPWKTLLQQFFQSLTGHDYSWARPNRRYRDMYLPSLQQDNEGLEHLIYYLDVSGSVSNAEVIRFNSEVKYIKETFNPARLTLVLFDTCIQREYEFYEDDDFNEVVIVGRGGTSLSPVREHMLQHRPTAAIIFSDLYCRPMEPLPAGIHIPTIWVAVNSYESVQVPFGKLIHIKE